MWREQNLAKVAASIEARKLKEANTVPEALGALARDPQQVCAEKKGAEKLHADH